MQTPTDQFKQPGFTEFLQTLGPGSVYYPSLAKLFHSVNAAIFVAQLIYWTPRAHDPDGWVYKSVEEWTDETALSYREQRQVRKHLVRLRVLEEHYDRESHRLYFRINAKILNDLTEVWFGAYPPGGT